jgi:hypothetical protein
MKTPKDNQTALADSAARVAAQQAEAARLEAAYRVALYRGDVVAANEIAEQIDAIAQARRDALADAKATFLKRKSWP